MTTAFSGAVPKLYDEVLGPILFEPYAKDLVARLSDLRAGVLLETAAGTGIVTRMLAESLPPSVGIVATDLNPDMIAIASKRPIARAVEWRQADAQSLPFADGEMNAVVTQFGMMFLPDKPKGYREAARVLRPGGRFIFSVWDSLEANPFSGAVVDALAERFPSDPPRFLVDVPHGYHDEARIRDDMASAGFSSVDVELVPKTSRATAARLALGLCQGTPVRPQIEARAPGALEAVTAEIQAAVTARFGDGELEQPMRALVVTALR